MFFTYEEALDWIHSRLRLGIKPGLSRMEWMMERLNHPERKIKTIHIGGTNGKGSTVTFLRSILQESGYSVGTFTSPYIEQFNERISINGVPITDKEILELTNIIKPLADELENTDIGGPTEFEVITAMSFYYFAHMGKVDFAIYEVGLGGRFDSTNIISPLLSIITNIGLDHTNILGGTHEEIAFEKAGIIKNDKAVITGVKKPAALKVITEQAENKNAPLFCLEKELLISNHTPLPRGESFTLQTPFQWLDCLEIGMIGKHQTENASLAVTAAQYMNHHFAIEVSEAGIRTGLNKSFWPGRFETISENPMIIIDGAHNEEGVNALVHELTERYREKEIHVVFAALRDKKLDGMIAKLDKIAERITFVSFDFPRAASARELFELSGASYKFIEEDWKSFLEKEMKNLQANQLMVITGSLYFISAIKKWYCQHMKD